MATLPSPSGGMNPWPMTLQQPQQPAPNPIIDALVQDRAARIERESGERTAALNQAGAVAPWLGGSGIISMLEQTLRSGGSMPDDFSIDKSFAAINDPSVVHGRNAESTLRQAQALEAAGSVGAGIELSDDARIREIGPMSNDALTAMIARAEAGAPTSVTYNQTAGSKAEDASTFKYPVLRPDGTVGYREDKQTNTRENEMEREGPSPGNVSVDPAQTQQPQQTQPQSQQELAMQRLTQMIKQAYGQQYIAQPPIRANDGNIAYPIYNTQDGTVSYLTEDDLRQIHSQQQQQPAADTSQETQQ